MQTIVQPHSPAQSLLTTELHLFPTIHSRPPSEALVSLLKLFSFSQQNTCLFFIFLPRSLSDMHHLLCREVLDSLCHWSFIYYNHFKIWSKMIRSRPMFFFFSKAAKSHIKTIHCTVYATKSESKSSVWNTASFNSLFSSFLTNEDDFEMLWYQNAKLMWVKAWLQRISSA